MRYLAIAAALVALAACGGDATQPSPTAEQDLLRITLQDDAVPPGIAILSEPQVAPVDSKACLLPGESTAGVGSTLVLRTFDAPEPFPVRGAQRVIVTSVLHSSSERAHSEFACASAKLSRDGTERLLGPEWQMFSFEELASPDVGEEGRVIHYVTVNAEGLVFLETYWATFRRREVTAVLNIRAPLENISLGRFESLAHKLDLRIQEGLGFLQ